MAETNNPSAKQSSMIQRLVGRGAPSHRRNLGMTAWSEFLQNVTILGALCRGNPDTRASDAREPVAILKKLLRRGVCPSGQPEHRISRHRSRQVRLVHVRQLARPSNSVEASSLSISPQNDRLLSTAPPQRNPWRSAVPRLRHLFIMALLGCALAIGLTDDAIGPHGILDLLTIASCLGPSAVIVLSLAGWGNGPAWLGPLLRFALLVAFIRYMHFSFWKRHPVWQAARLFSRSSLFLIRQLRVDFDPPVRRIQRRRLPARQREALADNSGISLHSWRLLRTIQ